MTIHRNTVPPGSVHPIAYVQATDPLAVGAGKHWYDTSDALDKVLKVRNVANDGWEVLYGTLKQFSVQIGHGTAAIGVGPRFNFRMHHPGTWVGYRLTAPFEASVSIVLDIWKDMYANFPPTVADTITASAKPTLVTTNKSEDLTLTGWTKTFLRGDHFTINVDSNTGCTGAVLSLLYYRT